MTETTNLIRIQIPSDARYAKIIRSAVSYICKLAGFNDTDENRIVLAVDEAVSNIIRHAYNSAADQRIDFGCRLHADRLEITLRDYGSKADPQKIKSRDLADVRPGGLGVHLMHQVMDRVEYDPQVLDGNLLRLTKYMKKG